MARLLLIDGNSIGYASQHATKLSNGGKPVQAIYGSLKTLQSLVRTLKDPIPVVLWDNKAQWRYDIHPEYKCTRTKTEKQIKDREEYAEQRPKIMELFGYLGVRQMEAENFEADDLAGYLVREAKPTSLVTLVTGDMDWAQLVGRKTVSWYDPRKDGRWIRYDTFTEDTGSASQSEFLLRKAIEGDSSDNIDGVDRVGVKAIDAVLDGFGGFAALMAHHTASNGLTKENMPDGFNTRFIKPLNGLCEKEGRERIKRNIELMNLMTPKRDAEIKNNLVITNNGVDMDAFFDRCLDLNFSSITSRPDLWNTTFGGV